MEAKKDFECGEPLGPRVTQATPLADYKLLIVFDNGEKRIFDAKPLLSYPCFKPLVNESFFKTVKVAFGSIAWPGDIDYCPDTLYLESMPV